MNKYIHQTSCLVAVLREPGNMVMVELGEVRSPGVSRMYWQGRPTVIVGRTSVNPFPHWAMLATLVNQVLPEEDRINLGGMDYVLEYLQQKGWTAEMFRLRKSGSVAVVLASPKPKENNA